MNKFDIYFNESYNGRKSLVYIKDYQVIRTISSSFKYTYCSIDLNGCTVSTLESYEFKNIYRNLIFIENKEVPEIEIMKLTNDYPEYFV